MDVFIMVGIYALFIWMVLISCIAVLQARAVIDGLPADMVALALPLDVQKIADAGLVPANWRKAYPNNSSGEPKGNIPGGGGYRAGRGRGAGSLTGGRHTLYPNNSSGEPGGKIQGWYRAGGGGCYLPVGRRHILTTHQVNQGEYSRGGLGRRGGGVYLPTGGGEKQVGGPPSQGGGPSRVRISAEGRTATTRQVI